MKILNFGSLNIDHVYRVDDFVLPGETKAAKEQSVNCGGKGLNQSIAAAKAGCSVFHAGMLGRDGEMLKAVLSASGVDVSFLRPCTALSGSAVIEVTDDGQNRILLYGGANRMLTPDQVSETLDAFSPDDIVLLQNETNLVGEIISEAAGRGMLTVLNAAPMNEAVRAYPLERLGWLIVNEVEGAAITGRVDSRDVFDALCSAYPSCGILLTLGSEGALCRRKEERCSIGACRVKPIDTTAAGDCFTGYFLHGIASGLPLRDTLRIATAASALCIQKPGASGSIPTPEEIDCSFGALDVPEVRAI